MKKKILALVAVSFVGVVAQAGTTTPSIKFCPSWEGQKGKVEQCVALLKKTKGDGQKPSPKKINPLEFKWAINGGGWGIL